jgi:hypothetical protein
MKQVEIAQILYVKMVGEIASPFGCGVKVQDDMAAVTELDLARLGTCERVIGRLTGVEWDCKIAAQITNAGDRKVGCTVRQRLALCAISRRIPCRAGTSR